MLISPGLLLEHRAISQAVSTSWILSFSQNKLISEAAMLFFFVLFVCFSVDTHALLESKFQWDWFFQEMSMGNVDYD